MVGFAAAILLVTRLTLEFSAVTGTPTAAFSFLIIVLLSAFFGDLPVAIGTSLVATLCFDYFYLPPTGTLHISAFADWISLAAFLLASALISRLAASAAEKGARADVGDRALVDLKEFGRFLICLPHEQYTLAGVAKEALRIFGLEYCSIHVYGEGRWQHFTGTAASPLYQEVVDRLGSVLDHPTELAELVDEGVAGVRYVQINEDRAPLALLAIGSRTLPVEAIDAIGHMVGVWLSAAAKCQPHTSAG
jgi:two-component system, OmpR family, sensor histidine kinase KdpD